MNKLWHKYPDEKPMDGKHFYFIYISGNKNKTSGIAINASEGKVKFFHRYGKTMVAERIAAWCYESDLIASITQPEADRATQPAEARNIKLIKALEKIKETEPAEKPGFFRYKIPNRADCAVIAEEALKNSN